MASSCEIPFVGKEMRYTRACSLTHSETRQYSSECWMSQRAANGWRSAPRICGGYGRDDVRKQMMISHRSLERSAQFSVKVAMGEWFPGPIKPAPRYEHARGAFLSDRRAEFSNIRNRLMKCAFCALVSPSSPENPRGNVQGPF